jgi:hypothetical protein
VVPDEYVYSVSPFYDVCGLKLNGRPGDTVGYSRITANAQPFWNMVQVGYPNSSGGQVQTKCSAGTNPVPNCGGLLKMDCPNMNNGASGGPMFRNYASGNMGVTYIDSLISGGPPQQVTQCGIAASENYGAAFNSANVGEVCSRLGCQLSPGKDVH